MKETLMAFLSMMLVMTFSMNQQEVVKHSQRNMVNGELGMMAAAAAAEVRSYIETRAFDARTKDGTVTIQNQDLDALTVPGSFPMGKDCSAATNLCTTIEDFNQMQTFRVDYVTDYDASGTPLGSLPFEVDVEVAYVDDNGNISSDPTWTKEVTMTVTMPVDNVENPTQLSIDPIVIKRQLSFLK